MIPCYYGSVNRWECDENDHLNVRFYAQKVHQALIAFTREVAAEQSRSVRVTGQHIRFVAEARIATPLRVDCALLAAADAECEVLALMVNQQNEAPVAGFVARLGLRASELRTEPAGVQVPDWAAPRGLDPASPYPPPDDLQGAFAAGFKTMGRGVIGSEECDATGQLLPHVYIGRISDGMPNLWAFTADEATAAGRGKSALGGAAVEYRLSIHRSLQAGDVFRHVSGIRAVGNKTQHMVHLLWNETGNELAATAEAIGVAMDLTTRRAVPVSEPRRRALARLQLR